VKDLRGTLASIRRNVRNIPGWKTGRRIVVFESDDWGSIRLPSKQAYDQFKQRGMDLASAVYNRYDSLESNDDLTALFDVLDKHKDIQHRNACFTANMILANPDFEKIKQSGFNIYHYELVQETVKRYPKHDRVIPLYLKGLDAGVFRPQFHGREHVQVNRWLRALRTVDKKLLYAFDCGTTYSGSNDYNFMESFDWDSPDEVIGQRDILRDGLGLFYSTFGYRSSSFIAPCYTWDPLLESTLEQEGIRHLQGGIYQLMPKGGFNNYVPRKHVMGERQNGLTYLTRNCFFEPTLVMKKDWIDYTLASVRDAFRWNKPAIICSHRINFVGSIYESNRDRNLKLLDGLLKRILIQWPDVEFMSSDQLGDLISHDQERF